MKNIPFIWIVRDESQNTAEEVKQDIVDSPVDVKGVNTEESALFLGCSMSQAEIDAENRTKVVNTRQAKKGVRPRLTCPAITGGPKVRAEDNACLTKCGVKFVMKNHYYSFNNQIRKQRKGGAMGNSLTEKIAKLVLKRFDRKFKAMLKTLKIEIESYRRYVDDITAALEPLDPGVRFVKEEMKMVKVQEHEESDKEEYDDKRTFEGLQKIANTIFNYIQFTTDKQFSHVEKMCAILDLQVFIDCPSRNQAGALATGEIRRKIKFVAFLCVFLTKIKVDPESW